MSVGYDFTGDVDGQRKAMNFHRGKVALVMAFDWLNAHAPVAPLAGSAQSFKDLIYTYGVTYGALPNQMAVTDDAIMSRAVGRDHHEAQRMVARPLDETLAAICAYRPANGKRHSPRQRSLMTLSSRGNSPTMR